MGIAGAGYATVLANWASALFGAYLLLRTSMKSATVCAPPGMEQGPSPSLHSLRSAERPQWALEVAFTVFLIFVGRFENGDAALASSSITVTIMMLAVLPAVGVAQAVMVLVGQHLGNGKRPDLTEEASWSGVQVSAMYIMTVG